MKASSYEIVNDVYSVLFLRMMKENEEKIRPKPSDLSPILSLLCSDHSQELQLADDLVDLILLTNSDCRDLIAAIERILRMYPDRNSTAINLFVLINQLHSSITDDRPQFMTNFLRIIETLAKISKSSSQIASPISNFLIFLTKLNNYFDRIEFSNAKPTFKVVDEKGKNENKMR